MKNIFVTIALSLLTVTLCSCGGGGGTPDCSSTSTAVQTSTGKVVAAATVAVAPVDGLSYSISGTNMVNVSGLQLDITYDSASLSSPTVTQGALVAGAIFQANISNPGIIRIAAISTQAFPVNGQIATVSFASRTGNGAIVSITTTMIGKTGEAIVSSGLVTSTANTACQ